MRPFIITYTEGDAPQLLRQLMDMVDGRNRVCGYEPQIEAA